MSNVIYGVIAVILLLVMIFYKIWIGAALAAIGFIGYAIIYSADKSLIMVASEAFSQIGNYSFATVILFTYMGCIIAGTGLGDDLFKTADKWMGRLRGGVAIASTVSCGIFGAVCGSSTACALTMSKIAYPEMHKMKYDDSLSAATVAAGGTIGFMIPPSIGFIMYGLITENSISKLFLAGVMPGIVQVILYILVIAVLVRKRPDWAPDNSARVVTMKEKIASLKTTWPILVLILVIVFGLYGGIFTATEAGAIGAVSALVLAAVTGKLSKKNLKSVTVDTAKTTGQVVLLLVGAYIFSRFLTITRLPERMTEIAMGISSPVLLISAICLLYIILGMFLDIYAITILTIPILYPISVAAGWNAIWFGVVLVKLMQIGMVTPPYGTNLFVTSSATGVPLKQLYKGSVPFLLADIVHLILIIAIPQMSLMLV
ncbi:MAG: TRAP transporter large permease [Oscillospiraceae bacterium]|uniref:TRAP transporter large permease n=1 Tax=Candidatus Limivicinus sp. TaxID=3030905 RepID=UPI002EA09D13|nr:TRAP transporter large permease [Oscillospiraceae bacterium]